MIITHDEEFNTHPLYYLRDQVKNPPYYAEEGEVQCIDAIKSSLTNEGYKGFLKGNIFKYLWRFEMKGGLEDLLKAEYYLSCLTENVYDDVSNENKRLKKLVEEG